MISAKRWNMNRYYWGKKVTVEECKKVTVYQLRKEGLLPAWCEATLRSGLTVETKTTDHSPYASLAYFGCDQRIELTTTRCNFGGVRYWFLCPCCSRRVGALYKAPGGARFMCRHCNDLSYWSRNRSRRSGFAAIVILVRATKQIEDLHAQIKRCTYKGKPTRKVRRLDALVEKIRPYAEQSESLEPAKA
jgi:hypothetical protein